jgi:hypothetical protein
MTQTVLITLDIASFKIVKRKDKQIWDTEQNIMLQVKQHDTVSDVKGVTV